MQEAPKGATTWEKQEMKPAKSTEKKLDELYKLISGINVAMFTSRTADGSLVSRPMATQKQVAGADLWFVTDIASHKIEEMQHDPHVNVAYLHPRTLEWVSVSGRAQIIRDRARIRELYSPDWRAWFGDRGDGVHNGGPDDPRLALIYVDADSVMYGRNDHSMPVVLWQVLRGMVSGKAADPATVSHVSAAELAQHQRGA